MDAMFYAIWWIKLWSASSMVVGNTHNISYTCVVWLNCDSLHHVLHCNFLKLFIHFHIYLLRTVTKIVLLYCMYNISSIFILPYANCIFPALFYFLLLLLSLPGRIPLLPDSSHHQNGHLPLHPPTGRIIFWARVNIYLAQGEMLHWWA